MFDHMVCLDFFMKTSVILYICTVFFRPSPPPPPPQGNLAEEEPVKTLQLEKTGKEIGGSRPEVQDGQLAGAWAGRGRSWG